MEKSENIKFIHSKIVTKELIKALKGKCVTHVAYSDIIGGIQEWRGELKGTEYFKIQYGYGELHISVAERESQYDNHSILFARSNIKTPETKSYALKIDKYEDLLNKLEEIVKPNYIKVSFDEILKFLGWKKANNVEVFEFQT